MRGVELWVGLGSKAAVLVACVFSDSRQIDDTKLRSSPSRLALASADE